VAEAPAEWVQSKTDPDCGYDVSATAEPSNHGWSPGRFREIIELETHSKDRPSRLLTIMTTAIQIAERPAIEYPDSDGLPMSDNTRQFKWIGTIMWGLDAIFLDDPNVFVAGDLLWYAVEGEPTIRIGPDILIAFNRPKGYRGSYKQWEEGNQAPQVVFEILSPGNRPDDTASRNTTSTTRTMGLWKAGDAWGIIWKRSPRWRALSAPGSVSFSIPETAPITSESSVPMECRS
jgi:hypothetical protein